MSKSFKSLTTDEKLNKLYRMLNLIMKVQKVKPIVVKKEDVVFDEARFTEKLMNRKAAKA